MSFIESTVGGVACFLETSVNNSRVQVLSIYVLLLNCSQDWTCNLQTIVSLEASNRYAVSCWQRPEDISTETLL